MIDLKLDASGDLEFDRDLALVSDIDEIKQELEIILKTNQGEFFGDTTMGLNQSEIFVKNPDLVLIMIILNINHSILIILMPKFIIILFLY